MIDHEALARQCEEAGADRQRELCEAAFAVLIVRPYLGSQAASDTKPLRTRSYFFNRKLDAEAYVDAALMLVPEGWTLMHLAGPFSDKPCLCTLGGGKSVGFCEGSAQTLALALLAAILRAQGGKDAD